MKSPTDINGHILERGDALVSKDGNVTVHVVALRSDGMVVVNSDDFKRKYVVDPTNFYLYAALTNEQIEALKSR